MRNKKIAITGGIGSGKSTFSEILRNKGYSVISADEIYTDISCETDYLSALSLAFPDCVKEGRLDRKVLAKRVFSNRADLEKLNSIAHPLIMERILNRMEKENIAFAEVPLLFENGFERYFDEVIYLKRRKEERIVSVMIRDGLTKAEVASRIQAQFDGENITEKDCLIINNDKGYAELEKEAERVLGFFGVK